MSEQRYIVAESSGYHIHATTRSGGGSPHVTEVMVLDRGYCHRVVWSSLTSIEVRHFRSFTRNRKGEPKRWRTKYYKATAWKWPLEKRRRYAADLAARLNAEAA